MEMVDADDNGAVATVGSCVAAEDAADGVVESRLRTTWPGDSFELDRRARSWRRSCLASAALKECCCKNNRSSSEGTARRRVH